MWTQNRVLAAPVVVSQGAPRRSPQPQAVVINSGIANAATGAQGDRRRARDRRDGRARCSGSTPEQVLVLSTGVIGAPLPIERVLAGVDAAAAALSADGGADAAEAILTTDTQREGQRSRTAPASCVGGMAKGSGMIHPNLATMLAVVTTDYPLEPGEAIDFLRPAVDESFNSISVDGECSTNDAVVLLASGAARSSARRRRRGVRRGAPHACAPSSRGRSSPTARARRWSPRSTSAARRPHAEASAIAQRIATSPLVKTALFGHDANWGRVLAAAGSRAVQRRLRAARPEPRVALLQRHDGARSRRAAGRRAGRRRRRVHDRPRPRPRRRHAPAT